jgi:hypothetical protein
MVGDMRVIPIANGTASIGGASYTLTARNELEYKEWLEELKHAITQANVSKREVLIEPLGIALTAQTEH